VNYIKLINQFWKLRRSKRITSKQADLYFFLIQECNERDWENPFECSNRSIIARIDMQEPTLIDARNRLKQLGLIDFKSGRKNEASPVYELLYLNNLSKNRGESIAETEENLKESPSLIKETKPKQNREVPNGTSEAGASAVSEAELRIRYRAIVGKQEELEKFIKDHRPHFVEPYVNLWNLAAEELNLPKVQALNDERRKKLKTRAKEKAFDFVGVLHRVRDANDFLRTGSWFTFDWVVENQKNYAKVLEGNYDKRSPQTTKTDSNDYLQQRQKNKERLASRF
jgi:hypothetical protein